MRLHTVVPAPCDTRHTREAWRRGFVMLAAGALLLGACSKQGGRRSDGSCEVEPSPPLVPTPLDFVSQFPFGSQYRSMTGIQHAFEADAARFEALIEPERKKDPCAGGTVLAAVAVRTDGTVVGVQILADDTHPDAIGPRVENAIRQMNFGGVSGSGYYTFQYPIRFNAAPVAAPTPAPAPAPAPTPAPAHSAAAHG